MSTALFVEGGAGCLYPARSSVAERIREIVAAARARDMRRLERLENRAIESPYLVKKITFPEKGR